MEKTNGVQIIAQRKSKLIYRDGDKLYKTFDESFSKSNVLNESLNHARIEETGLNIREFDDAMIFKLLGILTAITNKK